MGRRHRPLPAGSVVGGAMTGCLEVNRNAMPKAHTRRARVGATHASPSPARHMGPPATRSTIEWGQLYGLGGHGDAFQGDACVAPTRWG